ncbi:hypothetical protein [Labrys wisconsinensis]|uniref:Uncharacterized protein n=1 Tax=Labrys wisconsinensis TaxID=425677 RepID=A0ABU0JKZ0_9HYPH|nr:hypothetical protein [Labrys wisconsinensis]MDQ0474951.1 hypothetical protein [Labrys wisconsinensis]
MDTRIEEISLSLEALARRTPDRSDLFRQATASHPDASPVEMRRAALYAVTDPDRSDTELTLRLYDLAHAFRQ